MPDFHFLTTHVGSVPHTSLPGLTEKLITALDIPAWPQLPRQSFRENMYVQYSPTLPSVELDEEKQKIILCTREDLSPALETFYTPYLADDVDAFALRPEYATGFFAMLDILRSTSGTWAKGQVTGPVSFGLTVTDQELRATLYNDLLADTIVKNMAMIARWQVRQLKTVRPNIIIFADEPYMASFGSAFISLSREQVVSYLNEVFEAIHNEGALAGVHCCANTDWGLLLSTQVDILNLDAYGFIENLALYPFELREFLDRGGIVCWGIVPNNEEINSVTSGKLAQRLHSGIRLVSERAAARGVTIKPEELEMRSLISPACGLGSTTVEIADRVFDTLSETGRLLQRG
jgi:hypothetical protein